MKDAFAGFVQQIFKKKKKKKNQNHFWENIQKNLFSRFADFGY